MIPFWTQAEELSICFKKKKQKPTTTLTCIEDTCEDIIALDA